MILRNVTDEDLPIFFEHQRDPEALRMAAFPSRERDAFMIHWRTKVQCSRDAGGRRLPGSAVRADGAPSWAASGPRAAAALYPPASTRFHPVPPPLPFQPLSGTRDAASYPDSLTRMRVVLP
jgi:hypothetical protein